MMCLLMLFRHSMTDVYKRQLLPPPSDDRIEELKKYQDRMGYTEESMRSMRCLLYTSGQPVTIQLDREVDVSRGCVLTIGSGAKVASSITATIPVSYTHLDVYKRQNKICCMGKAGRR